MAALLLLGLAMCPLALAQFVTAPTNLTSKLGHANVTVRYKEVPAGICEQDPDVKSYAGYADVAEDQHIFWWFFEARNVDPTTAPLTVWINGGPGSSSMIGLFQELGPCTVNSSGAVVENPYSWSNVSNMLFIDQPSQVGFSYSVAVPAYADPVSGLIVTLPNDTCPDYASDWDCGTYSLPDPTSTANSTPNAAPNMYKTLQGFIGAFPNYSNGDFFFTTESYGGHYGPIFNQYFLDQNKIAANDTVPINLKGVMIGNGWFDPLIQYQAYYNFSVYPGNTYDIDPYNASIKSLAYNNLYGAGNCYDQMIKCYDLQTDTACATADNFCYYQVEDPFDIYAGRDEYDSRELSSDPFPPEFYVDYLNTPEVQAAIGAYVNFSEFSPTVGSAFSSTGDDARGFNITSVIGELVSENVTVVLYFGDADYNCNWLGGQAILPLIEPAPPSFSTAGFTPILTSTSNTTNPRGLVRQSANFAFLRIFESGHEVPFYQPELSLTVFDRVTRGLDIATGQVLANAVGTNYTTSGPLTSDYREGNGTVQYDDIPVDATYDTDTGLPVLPPNSTSSDSTSTAGDAVSTTLPTATSTAEARLKRSEDDNNKRDRVINRVLSRKRTDRQRAHRRHASADGDEVIAGGATMGSLQRRAQGLPLRRGFMDQRQNNRLRRRG